MAERIDEETGEITDALGRDREVEALLREGANAEHIAQLIEQDHEGYVLALGRALARRRVRMAALAAMRARMLHELDVAMDPLDAEWLVIERALSAELLRLRDVTGGEVKSLLVPGVGEWKSVAVAGGFTFEAAEVVAALAGDERAMFVRDVPTLDSTTYRKALAGELDDEPVGAAIPPQVSDDRRREARDEAGRRVAARHAGVAWRPSRVSVSSP